MEFRAVKGTNDILPSGRSGAMALYVVELAPAAPVSCDHCASSESVGFLRQAGRGIIAEL